MSTPGGEQIYATLLLSDSYLPGALVLAHSLRDAQTSKKLAVLVTLDSVSADAISQLRAVYDYVLPVPRIRNNHPANLYLMNRTDLHSAFTKINLWKQVQFSKIVYIDADVIAYRAPDELFAIEHAFSAAPDIGWPDLFNTGVMVLTPNMGDYYAMMAMAERGISFDGADQGLLNMHFKNSYNRLSFTYNVTPSAHYQYLPAYRHFQSSINMVHFIGANKPWFEGRNAPHGNSPYDEMVGRWWAVHDRHYRAKENSSHAHNPMTADPTPQQAAIEHVPNSESYRHQDSGDTKQSSLGHSEHHQLTQEQSAPAHAQPKRFEPPRNIQVSWDAQRHPPPAGSKPEAENFPATQYVMSRDATPFKPPRRYPSPPRDMWYEVPKQRPAQPAAHVFPWEVNRPQPTRFFADDPPESPEAPKRRPEPIDTGMTSTTKSSTPTTPTIKVTHSDPWTAFSRNNAWDEMPEINRYVDGLQTHKRNKSGSSSNSANLRAVGLDVLDASPRRRAGLKLTDFPSKDDRPSLPVTPAPISRPSFWGDDATQLGGASSESGQPLPSAEGVPVQSDWDPQIQLQKLAKQQYDVLLQKLGGNAAVGGFDALPKRSLPFGSEDSKSPTYVLQSPPDNIIRPTPVKGEATIPVPTEAEPLKAEAGSADAATLHEATMPHVKFKEEVV